jgi:hypothetical protein
VGRALRDVPGEVRDGALAALPQPGLAHEAAAVRARAIEHARLGGAALQDALLPLAADPAAEVRAALLRHHRQLWRLDREPPILQLW